jgi:hypothetical protein
MSQLPNFIYRCTLYTCTHWCVVIDRLSLQVVYLWRHVSSTAPPLILWWSNLEILLGPCRRSSPYIGELRCQASQMEQGPYIAEGTLKAVYIVRCLWVKSYYFQWSLHVESKKGRSQTWSRIASRAVPLPVPLNDAAHSEHNSATLLLPYCIAVLYICCIHNIWFKMTSFCVVYDYLPYSDYCKITHSDYTIYSMMRQSNYALVSRNNATLYCTISNLKLCSQLWLSVFWEREIKLI